MEGRGVNLEPAVMQALRAAVSGDTPPDPGLIQESIIQESLSEEAAELLRVCRREVGVTAWVETLAARLSPLAVKAQRQRMDRWHLDTRRTLVRFHYAKEGYALGFDEGDLHVLFLQAFRLEGLSIVLDLGKRPRPMLVVGLPLPLNVGGSSESMDVTLKREPEDPPASLMARLNRRLPEGVRIHQWSILPGYASPISDLALCSHWRWEVPLEVRKPVEKKLAAFLAASDWPWDRGTSKANARLDLRALVPVMRWEEDALCFSTVVETFQALNPIKVLSAILGLAAEDIHGLVRTQVDLKPDARLGQAERFEPKLKNMYEDAVLLGGGSNITLVDEDDDEPIVLG